MDVGQPEELHDFVVFDDSGDELVDVWHDDAAVLLDDLEVGDVWEFGEQSVDGLEVWWVSEGKEEAGEVFEGIAFERRVEAHLPLLFRKLVLFLLFSLTDLLILIIEVWLDMQFQPSLDDQYTRVHLPLQSDDLLHAHHNPHQLILNLLNAVFFEVAEIQRALGDEYLPIGEYVLQVVVELVDELVAVLSLAYDLQLSGGRLLVDVLTETAEGQFGEVHGAIFELHVAFPHEFLDGLVEAVAEPVVQSLSDAHLQLELVALDLGGRDSRCDEADLEELEPEEQVEECGHDECFVVVVGVLAALLLRDVDDHRFVLAGPIALLHPAAEVAGQFPAPLAGLLLPEARPGHPLHLFAIQLASHAIMLLKWSRLIAAA